MRRYKINIEHTKKKNMNKNYYLLFLLLLLGTSVGVYGQKRTMPDPRKGPHSHRPENLIIPIQDSVILHGEEIEVGAFLSKKWDALGVEVSGLGKSQESDFKKGFYVIKQKPKQTITYKFVIQESEIRVVYYRTVYVAKNEEEKKQLEKQIKEKFEAKKEAERKTSEAVRRGERVNIGHLLPPPPQKK